MKHLILPRNYVPHSLLILRKSPKRWFIFVETYSICSVQVKSEDKVTPKYRIEVCNAPMTTSLSSTETDIAVAQFAIAAHKHELGLLYVKSQLVLLQPQSYSWQIFIKSILEIQQQ